MTWILVTNDDGVDATALPPLARAIGEVAPIRVVAPDTERSWIGKAITRDDPIRVESVTRDGIEMYATSGYPADCVQVAINVMFDTPPSLVVSGINLGFNHGTAYLQSSGTVGAVLEAYIGGIDGLALSTGTPDGFGGNFREWRSWASSRDSLPMWGRLAAISAEMAAGMLRAGPMGVTVNVNFPQDADLTTERRLTTVADTGYGQLFREESPGVYVHDYRGLLHHRSASEGTDVATVNGGVVSVAAVRSISETAMPASLPSLLGVTDTGDRPHP